MPNTGKPSQDCHLCRARRVKCDLNKPACARCINYGAPCPGYRDEMDLRFRHQDVNTVGKRNQRKDRGAKEKGGSSPAPSATSSTPMPMPMPMLTRLSQRIADPDHFRAVEKTLARYLARMNGTEFHGWLDFLPDLFLEIPDESCLFLAVNVFANAPTDLETDVTKDVDHVRTYGKAIRAVNDALSHPDRCKDDATIMSVWLLSHYEIVVGSQTTGHVPAPDAWHIHIQGLTSLLRIRGLEQLSTRRGRNIFCIMYGMIVSRHVAVVGSDLLLMPPTSSQQVQCIIGATDLPPESLQWLEVLGTTREFPHTLGYTTLAYSTHASFPIIRLSKLLRSASPAEMVSALPELSLSLSAAEALAASIEPHNRLELPYLHLLNMCRATRIRLNYLYVLLVTTIMDLRVQIPELREMLRGEDLRPLIERRRQCVRVCHQCASEITEGAPYALGLVDITTAHAIPRSDGSGSGGEAGTGVRRTALWSDGMAMLWPLTLITLNPLMPAEQQQKAVEGLQMIMTRLGIRQAGALYPRQGAWRYQVNLDRVLQDL